MSVEDKLDCIKTYAKNDESFKRALLETKGSKNPLKEFCYLCEEKGVEISPMEIDLYEMFLIEIGEADIGDL